MTNLSQQTLTPVTVGGKEYRLEQRVVNHPFMYRLVAEDGRATCYYSGPEMERILNSDAPNLHATCEVQPT